MEGDILGGRYRVESVGKGRFCEGNEGFGFEEGVIYVFKDDCEQQ